MSLSPRITSFLEAGASQIRRRTLSEVEVAARTGRTVGSAKLASGVYVRCDSVRCKPLGPAAAPLFGRRRLQAARLGNSSADPATSIDLQGGLRTIKRPTDGRIQQRVYTSPPPLVEIRKRHTYSSPCTEDQRSVDQVASLGGSQNCVTPHPCDPGLHHTPCASCSDMHAERIS